MDSFALTLTGAYLLDLGLGDPRWLPHPIRGLGWLIGRSEKLLRRWFENELLAGWFLVAGIALGTFVLVQGLRVLFARWSPFAAWGLDLLLLYICLSTRDLAVESWPVYRALRKGDLGKARAKVAMIVGRDTERLNEPEIVRATVETIGESIMDGIISPLFYAAIGGAPLACLYKAVNTLDSMVGYRSARYLKFGKAAALVDSWMNWIPARLTAGLIALSAVFVGFSTRDGFRVLFRDAWSQGQNSWLPEAALAGALGVQVGGINVYAGVPAQTPLMGDPDRPLEPEVIPQAIRIMYACSALGFGMVLAARWLF